MHNARSGKSGVFSPRHNDRSFNTEKDGHINSEKSDENFEWKIRKNAIDFEETEKEFYEKHFRKSLDRQNERYLKNRHKERIKTMDEYRKSRRYCPEETIYQVGSVGDSISEKELTEIILEQLRWEKETFPQAKILDVAGHFDEATPHFHVRRVWVAHDDEGLETVYQNRSLDEMGIQRPDPSKPVSATNNAKMTYTQRCREHLQELCKKRGLDIETEPRGDGGKDLKVWKAEQDLKKAEKELKKAKKSLESVREEAELVKSIEKSSRKAQTPEIKAKALGSGVVVQSDPETVRNAFIALQRQSDMLNAEKKARKKAKDLKIQATKEARSEVKSLEKRAEDLEKTLSSAEERVAQRQLNEIKEDFPQIFNSLGVYQRGHSVAERKAMQVFKDERSK